MSKLGRIKSPMCRNRCIKGLLKHHKIIYCSYYPTCSSEQWRPYENLKTSRNLGCSPLSNLFGVMYMSERKFPQSLNISNLGRKSERKRESWLESINAIHWLAHSPIFMLVKDHGLFQFILAVAIDQYKKKSLSV